MARSERRSAPRLEVVDELFGQIVAFAVRLTIRELGPGGFSIEGPLPFPRGAKHLFRFTSAAGVQVLINATVTHSRSTGDFMVPRYVTGFSFVQDGSAETEAKIEILLDALLAGLEFDDDAPSSAVEPAHHVW